MTSKEKLKALLEILVSKAVLSQNTVFTLLLGDVQSKDLEVSDVVTMLSRLQGEKALDVLRVTQAENTKPPGRHLRLVEEMFAPRFDTEHIDQNILTESHLVKIALLAPFISELDRAAVGKDEIEALSSLFTVGTHPEKVDIFCPLERSTVAKIDGAESWKELAKGKVFKCKERRHDVRVIYRNEQIIVSVSVVNSEESHKKS